MSSDLDDAALERLLAAVLEAEVSASEAPHVVVTTCLDTGIVTYSGPYPNAVAALDAANDCGWPPGDPAVRSVVAQLIPPE